MRNARLAIALSTGLALLGQTGFLCAAEARFYQIEDPVEAAFERAADGAYEPALLALRKAVDEAPNDSEAWATLSVVSQAAGLGAEARSAAKRTREADPVGGPARLKALQQRFKKRQAQILAEKEARGEIPLALQSPEPTPDPKVWDRLERERKLVPSPTPDLVPASEFYQGPRLLRKQASKLSTKKQK